MNESEFRDWSRRQMNAFDNRLKALEGKVATVTALPPRVRHGTVRGDFLTLAQNLHERVGEGRMTAMAIAFTTDDGVAHVSWQNEPFDHLALCGAVAKLLLDVIGLGAKDEVEVEAPGDQAP